MSASSKKKLRKEQNDAATPESKKAARKAITAAAAAKEAKRLTIQTLCFFIVMAIILLACVGIWVNEPIMVAITRNTNAISVGGHVIGAVEFNYYYCQAVNDFYSNLKKTYSDQVDLYAQFYYGVNFSQPLNEQKYTADMTWGDYFIDIAQHNAQAMYALYDLAMSDSTYTPSEEVRESVEYTKQGIELSATALGYKNATKYLKVLYGPGADLDSYMKYHELNTIAAEYYSLHEEALEYTDADYREFEKDKYNDYTCYTYASATLGMTHFIEEGKEQDEAAQQAALAEAKKNADALVAGTYADVEAFKTAVKNLEINKLAAEKAEDKTKDTDVIKTSEIKNIYFQSISNEDVKTWLSNPERKAGDMTIIEAKNVTTDAEGKETSKVVGYYVLYFQSERDNTMPLANVRHILVKFTGTKDADGNYSEADKQATLDAANVIYNEWKNGETVDDASFAALAMKKSEDTGTKTNGGLIEDITPDDNLVENFLNWCFDNRTPGDHGIVESQYGYHIMYYSSHDEMTYRDTMIKADLIDKDMENWLEEIQKPYTLTELNMKRVYFDYIPG